MFIHEIDGLRKLAIQYAFRIEYRGENSQADMEPVPMSRHSWENMPYDRIYSAFLKLEGEIFPTQEKVAIVRIIKVKYVEEP